jgi:ABC-type nitrate/sulfonate/bicarbonate transport system substrate-binding protein
MTKLRITLDWTPNANHVGIYLAHELGYYRELGIDLEIIDAGFDNYKTTPAKKVELSMADFAICPLESVLSYRTKSWPFPLKAIATILKKDLSAIVCKSSPSIKSPKDLDGKTYASYNARYEDAIVKSIIKNDGGSGDIIIKHPEKLGIWETIMKGDIDATWIFTNWESVQAQHDGVPLTSFYLSDYGIPYSYSPVIAANEEFIKTHSDEYKDFLTATKRGYLYAKNNVKEAADLLRPHLPEHEAGIDLEKCIDITCNAMGDDQDWGMFDDEKVALFLNWLRCEELDNSNTVSNNLYTNHLL